MPIQTSTQKGPGGDVQVVSFNHLIGGIHRAFRYDQPQCPGRF